MKEKTIVSGVTLLTSLLSYWYAKASDKDAVPYVMFGGFIGSIVGELLADSFNPSKK
ncbi:MAG: hypothetical protein QM764_09010 [Chitinophagaceae bacterium]